ncbi:MAG: sterol desaturase family protein [Microthrixaceae bacterium]
MDLISIAIPGFWASMGYEAWWLKRRAQQDGPSPVDYELKDTMASLAMGTGSLVVPLVAARMARSFAAPSGKYTRKALAVAAAAASAATVIDGIRRSRNPDGGSSPASGSRSGVVAPPEDGAEDKADTPTPSSPGLARVAGVSALTAIASGGFVAASTWSAQTTGRRLFERRIVRDLGGGALGVAAGIIGWDFIYYWNHRLMHESRIMWAIHVVHHSSERYNLSTALRQPWADSLGMFVPYGLLALLGVRPEHIETGRQINLIYQFWIHTDAIRSIGPLEEVLNTASHHRVHHGMDAKYLDRNHGSILIIWDRLFGTFQREEEPPTYGLTKNINTFNPLRIAGHEHAQIAKDVVRAEGWHDRLSHVLRGPGWMPDRSPHRPGTRIAAAVSMLRR